MALLQNLPNLMGLTLAGDEGHIIPDGLGKLTFDKMVEARQVPFRLYFRWEEDLDDDDVEEMQQWPDNNLGGFPPLKEGERVVWMESFQRLGIDGE
ncbi:hypothetical protein HDU93_005761 [Gonapodya sp. JEL0774]|nr:hypothetical protein HDU93_005761 [Gonapodya sp. JEL0774]